MELGGAHALRLLSTLARALSRAGDIAAPETANRLLAVVAKARDAWPDVELDPDAFVSHLAERLDKLEEDATLDDALTKLERLHVGDLYLACACARGDTRAIAHFDERLLSDITKHVRKVCQAGDDIEEIRQVLRTRMLVRGEDEPRILSYGGRGPLAGWLRVAAVRVARDVRRSRGVVADAADGPMHQAPDTRPLMDPELAVMKARYSGHFRAALNDVLSSLPDRERNILAMSVIDGVSTDAIGALYRVDGSTVRRWIAQLRVRVLEDVRARLKTALNIGPTEFDSLMGLVRSQIDLNLSQLLLGSGEPFG